MSSISKKTKVIIIIFSTLCIGSWVLYSYTVSFIKTKESSISDLDVYIANQVKKQSEISRLKNELKKTTDQRESLSSHIISTSNIVKFLESIEDLGKQSNTSVKISSVEFTKDKPLKLKVSFRASGSFGDLYKLLQLAENMPFEVQFLNVSLNEDQVAVGSSVKKGWIMDITLNLISIISE